jgi:glycosyltransferase involved in cell wall biosynthesis
MGIPLVADIRDAWSANPNMRYATTMHQAAARRHQERVCKAASLVIAVSPPIAEEAAALGARDTVVIPNGFDPAEMPALEPTPEAPLTLGFMGRFYGLTDPAPLLDAMASMAPDDPLVRFEVVGPVEHQVRDAVTARELADTVTFHGYLPHDEALATIARCDMGVVLIAEHPGSDSVYTGKLFEYLGMGIPVLLIGPEDGVAAKLVRENAAGVVVGYRSWKAVADALRECAQRKSLGEQLSSAVPGTFARYERAEQAKQLAGRLADIVGKPS